MGAENSILEGCQWGEDVLAAGLDWDLQHASAKDGRPITVFQPRKSERKYKDMIHQLAKSLKMLRHPNILRYIGAGKSSEGCFLVTEQATPLASVLDSLSPLEVCAGLSDVLDALMFLHDKAGVTHNNIGIGAVFVAKDGGWRLGELQHACPFSAATAEFLDACRAYRDQAALSPEETQGGVEVKAGQGHARDMFALGVFIELLSEQLTELGEFSKTFEERLGACLSADPAHRPRVLELKNDSLFQNDFIQILNFVRNVALKTSEEKAEFFSGLLPRLLALPEELVAHRLAVPLLSRFVLLDEAAVTHVVPHLLTPRSDPDATPSAASGVTPVLNSDLFKAHIIPELQRIFSVHDAHIRLVLLQHFSSYVHLFEEDVLQNEIFPQILLGLRDSSDAIVASSFRALADLVPLLGGDTVIGGPRKTFFFHGLPKFSTTKDKEILPDSVTNVMKHVKSDNSLLLPNGKPLLKDLAAGIVCKLSLDPAEQERKALERERRREEARQRKEERQRKLKQQQLDAESDRQKVDSSTKSSSISDATSRASDNRNTADSNPDKGDGDSLKIGGKLGDAAEDGDDSVNEDDRDKADDGVHLEEEKFASEESEEEWEDWDENTSDSGHKVTDDVISVEIETELSQMSGSGEPRQFGSRKVPTSPDPYRPGSSSSSAMAEWSDTAVDSRFGAPGTPEHLKSNVIGGESDRDRATIGSGAGRPLSHADSKQTSAKGLKLVAKSKTTAASSTKTAQAKKPAAAADDLGLGYDIKSIELTAVKELDFFADMVPDIKPTLDKSGVVSGVAPEEGVASGRVAEGHVALDRFAVADTTKEEESGGWGDEGDWEADEGF